MKVASLSKLSNKKVLAGSPEGRRMREILSDLAKASDPGLFVIDFAQIDVATSSFVREAVVIFRNLTRAQRADLYPVVANLNAEVEEELTSVLLQMGDAIWLFDLSKMDVTGHRLLGKIDPKLRETLDLIENGAGYDAATRWKTTNSTESVGVTAWNNRLANLAKQGLAFESKVGKQKYYHPLRESTV